MAVAVVTAFSRGISGATQGIPAIQINISARASGATNCFVAVVHHAISTVQDCIWDVCGGSPQTMTTVGEVHRSGQVNIKSFYQMNPNTGEHLMRAHVSGTAAGTTNTAKAIAVYALSGVADSGTVENFTSYITSISATQVVSLNVPSTANNLVIDGLAISGTTAASTVSAETDQTEQYDLIPPGASAAFRQAGSYQTGETSTRMSWEVILGANNNFVHCGFDVVATAAVVSGPSGGAASRPGLLSLLGAGR